PLLRLELLVWIEGKLNRAPKSRVRLDQEGDPGGVEVPGEIFFGLAAFVVQEMNGGLIQNPARDNCGMKRDELLFLVTQRCQASGGSGDDVEPGGFAVLLPPLLERAKQRRLRTAEDR